MARKEHGNPLLKQLIKERGIKDLQGIHELVKELTGSLIQEMLEAELENDLGYSKWDYREKGTTNSRNGYSEKTLKSSLGEIPIKVPRDRDGEFEPQLVKKHQTDISVIEDKILFLYAQGMSTRDIQKTINELYGTSVDDTMVSRITDKILPVVREWQQRPLEKTYPMLILDAIHLKVREEGVVVTKAAYIVIGINNDGLKDVLGIWLGATEVAFPRTEIQRCVIHQIRSSTRYVSYKDRREFINDLKPVYKSATENEALNALESLENKWSGKYRFAVKSWRDNWNELSTMFKYPPEIRRLIYTTNAIESFNRQLRKATKTKSAFVSDDAAMKLLYLTTMKVVEKWTMQLRDWGQIISTLSIYFGDRVTMKK